MQKIASRFPAVDAARGVAIVMMMIFHFVYDLNVFYGLESLRFSEGFWYFFGKTAAVLFFLIFGISGVLAQKKYGKAFAKRCLIKALKLLALAGVITAASFLIDADRPIYFGVLHFLAVSALLMPFFMRLRNVNLLIAACCYVGGVLFQSLHSTDFLLLPLGIRPNAFASADYFPLLPWFAFILVGIVLGKIIPNTVLQTGGKNRSPALALLIFAGRHSLFIYVVHQPVLIGLLALIRMSMIS